MVATRPRHSEIEGGRAWSPCGSLATHQRPAQRHSPTAGSSEGRDTESRTVWLGLQGHKPKAPGLSLSGVLTAKLLQKT